jgi:prevent-host-death family protein
MTEVSTVDVRERLSELVNRVHYGKERVVVTRRGKRLIALVPVDDLELIEAIEDRIDVQTARTDLKEKRLHPTDQGQKAAWAVSVCRLQHRVGTQGAARPQWRQLLSLGDTTPHEGVRSRQGAGGGC